MQNSGTFDKKKFISQNSIWLVLLALIAIVSIFQPKFLSFNNMITLISGEAVRGIMAFGMMFAICSRGIDLSVGASAALVAVISASLVQNADYANRLLTFGPLPAVRVEDGEDQEALPSVFVSDDEYSVWVMFSARRPVTNFEVLDLEMTYDEANDSFSFNNSPGVLLSKPNSILPQCIHL